MKYLFNSKGKHIANFINENLHSPTGSNIGHFLKNEEIFIDMAGRYLGEIVYDNRLMYNRLSSHKNVNYGMYGSSGNCGNHGNPGQIGSIGFVSGFDDVTVTWT